MISIAEFRTLSREVRSIVIQHIHYHVGVRCTCSFQYPPETDRPFGTTCAEHKHLVEFENVDHELTANELIVEDKVNG
jgi:hypothetical protein